MKKIIKIGNGQGFWGDSIDAPVNLAKSGNIDYLTLDYLAEVTMSIMQKQKNKNPNAGYAKDFIPLIEKILPYIKKYNLKVITNAGGANPHSCREELIAKIGSDVKIVIIEGDDICAGTVDVIGTDGFTGNIALKTAEGTAKMFGNFLREALGETLLGKFGGILAKSSLKQFKMQMDPRLYNGAMLLGLNGICVKSHGGTDALGFSNAVCVTADLIENDLNKNIKDDYDRLHTA